MLIKLNALINDFKGFPVTAKAGDTETELRLKEVLLFSLMAHHKEKDTRLEGEEIFKQYNLAKKIAEASEEIELEYKEIALLKKRILVVYGDNHNVLGASWGLLS